MGSTSAIHDNFFRSMDWRYNVAESELKIRDYVQLHSTTPCEHVMKIVAQRYATAVEHRKEIFSEEFKRIGNLE